MKSDSGKLLAIWTKTAPWYGLTRAIESVTVARDVSIGCYIPHGIFDRILPSDQHKD